MAVFSYICLFGMWMSQRIVLEVFKMDLLCIWS